MEEKTIKKSLKTIVCEALIYNEETKEVENYTFNAHFCKTEKTAEKMLKASLTETKSFIKMLSCEPTVKTYSITLEDFLANATEVED